MFLVSFPTASSGTAGDLPICTLPKCLNPQVTTKSGIGTANATAEAKVHPEDAAKWRATYKPRDKYCPKEQVKTGWIGFRSLYRAGADCVAGRMNAIDGGVYTPMPEYGKKAQERADLGFASRAMLETLNGKEQESMLTQQYPS